MTARPLDALLLGLLLSASACLKPWDVGGPWRCGQGDVCPTGFTCDDQVCCKPGGEPACPTLPAPNGSCPSGEAKVYFEDADGDGDGNEKLSRVFCRQPRMLEGKPVWVATGTDCDDTNPAIFFGAPELCNGKDDNCDRRIDEGLPNQVPFFLDEDGDGAGDNATRLSACMAPPGYVDVGDDCAPLDPKKFPGAQEQCNGLDDDCDGFGDATETTFVDTDTPGSGEVRFPCVVTSASGVCRAGSFRCEAGVRACRSTVSTSFDACDGLDNDCDGTADQHPNCGGPLRLIGIPGARYRAQRITTATNASLQGGCQANLPGTATSVSANGRVWSGGSVSGSPYNVWSIEAPAGTYWDLSKLNGKLRLKFDATFTPVTSDAGVWGNPAAGAAFNPVVYLCGATDTEVVRYRIYNVANAFKLNDMTFVQDMPLNNDSPTWLVGAGSGFNTARVRRIEVVLYTTTSDFTVTFDETQTGFLP